MDAASNPASSAASKWIEVVGWDRLQHYRDRDPIWIKNYTRLMADDAYLELTEHRALMLHRLWMEYASSGRRLAADTRTLSHRLALRVTTSDLQSLSDAGFIRLTASAPLAPSYQDASEPASTDASALRARATRSREKIREEDPLTPAQRGNLASANGPTPRDLGTNPRALGTNPRAADERAQAERAARRAELHAELLERAWVVAAGWNGGRSDLFDETLDNLEREVGSTLTSGERSRLWDGALGGGL